MGVLMAGFWGMVGGLALMLGALIGLYAGAGRRLIAMTMSLGAGVLISALAFELMEEAYQVGGFDAASIGLLLGSLSYFGADLAVNRAGGRHRKRSGHQQDRGGSGLAIAVGSMLDGIPESVAIGASLLGGGSVSAVTVAAVFLSNVPEGLSSTSGMKRAGRSARFILSLWAVVVAASAAASALGYLLLAGASGNVLGAIQAFAAGAILTMLASTMMPEAFEEGGPLVGLVTTIGFLAAFVLGHLE